LEQRRIAGSELGIVCWDFPERERLLKNGKEGEVKPWKNSNVQYRSTPNWMPTKVFSAMPGKPLS
jgi:hypothetical protein